MTMKREIQKSYKGRMMIGQAGTFRVMSELLLRGHVPSVPSVDTGVDILLDNGLRIQVKTSHLRSHPNYPEGVYHFSIRDSNFGKRYRDWSKIVDFMVFWGVEESRFFVIPACDAVQSFWISPKSVQRHRIDAEAIRTLRAKGMTYTAITQQLGCSRKTISRSMASRGHESVIRGNQHLALFEERWDLLNMNQALASIEVAAVVENS
jgi:hypothetical protein